MTVRTVHVPVVAFEIVVAANGARTSKHYLFVSCLHAIFMIMVTHSPELQ